MPLLHLAQRGWLYYPTVLADIAEICEISPLRWHRWSVFTPCFMMTRWEIRLQVCTDVACRLRGAENIWPSLCNGLGIKPGETTADGLITIEEVKCLAACDHAPVFQSQMVR